jgi:hypothetical protein
MDATGLEQAAESPGKVELHEIGAGAPLGEWVSANGTEETDEGWDWESDVRSETVGTGLETRAPGCEQCTSPCDDCWVADERRKTLVDDVWHRLPLCVREAIERLVKGWE